MRQVKVLNPDFAARGRLLPRLILLTTLKEGYLLLANAYGFLFHPYLTLKRISRDRSQMAIFLSLLLGAWLGIFLVFVTALLVIPWFFPRLIGLRKYGLALSFFGGAALFLFIIYLAYWLMILWRKK